MRILTSGLIFLNLLIGCSSDGRAESLLLEPQAECMLLALDEVLSEECEALIYNGEWIAGAEVRDRELRMLASAKKSSRARFTAPVDFRLPRQVQAKGQVHKGERLYIKFDDQTDCVWFANEKNQYVSPRCVDGAKARSASLRGFEGGIEVSNKVVRGVSSLRAEIQGSKNRSLTTAAPLFQQLE